MHASPVPMDAVLSQVANALCRGCISCCTFSAEHGVFEEISREVATQVHPRFGHSRFQIQGGTGRGVLSSSSTAPSLSTKGAAAEVFSHKEGAALEESVKESTPAVNAPMADLDMSRSRSASRSSSSGASDDTVVIHSGDFSLASTDSQKMDIETDSALVAADDFVTL